MPNSTDWMFKDLEENAKRNDDRQKRLFITCGGLFIIATCLTVIFVPGILIAIGNYLLVR